MVPVPEIRADKSVTFAKDPADAFRCRRPPNFPAPLASREGLIHTRKQPGSRRKAPDGRPARNGTVRKENRVSQGRSNEPLHIWQFSDRRLGHLRQSEALIEGCASLRKVEVRKVQVHKRPHLWQGHLRTLIREVGTGRLPRPDLLFGTGHGTHLPLLYTRLRTRAKTVVLMQPSLPLGWFDAAVIPEHDAPPPHRRVIRSRGALAPGGGEGARDAGRGLIMVGGPSRYFKWNPALLERQIDFIAQRTGRLDWVVTDSPRTPPDLRVPEQTNCRFSSWREQPKGWLQTQLSRVGCVWVTPDSASMLADAMNTSAEVNLLELPSRHGHNKLLCQVQKLEEEARVQQFHNWINRPLQGRNNQPLNDQFRCARKLLKLLDLHPGPA